MIKSWLKSYFLANDNLFSLRAFLSLGIVDGPIPCNFKSSFSEYLESLFNVLIPAASSALLAGADMLERKPVPGFFSASQNGQTGQSLLL